MVAFGTMRRPTMLVFAALVAVLLSVGMVAAEFKSVVLPGQTVQLKGKTGGFTKLEFFNDSGEEACLEIESSGYSGQVCVPANGSASLTKSFGRNISVKNLSTIATISISGKWL